MRACASGLDAAECGRSARRAGHGAYARAPQATVCVPARIRFVFLAVSMEAIKAFVPSLHRVFIRVARQVRL
eukprot:131288-Pleurochrysis_carterae.AAC.1